MHFYWHTLYYINTYVTKVLLLLLVPKGVPWNPPWEIQFPTRILHWNLHHICTGNKKSQFCKKNFKCCTVSKWRPNNRFLFRVISNLAKFWKKQFPKGIFQWNLAQRRRIWIDLHCWNNILKKLFCFKMVAKTIFWYCAIMLIYAN